MNINIILDYLIISAMVSLGINLIARNVAKTNNVLVDLPDRNRKFHKRPTPLTGGLSIFISLLISAKLYIDLNELNGFIPLFSLMLVIGSFFILVIFLIDDLISLRPSIRLIAQVLCSYFVIHTSGVYLENLGDLLGFGEIYLGNLGIPVTIFCVVGIMNAFNMIDGINGLCAGSALVMLLFTGFASNFIYDSMLVILIGSMLGFSVFNLGIIGKKRGVFLGDHGSNFIGFVVAWVAIHCSQNEIYNLAPMTTVWFVAIPFLDCIALIISRTLRGISWAAPGRDHIHHKLMQKYSPEMSLLIILFFSSLLNLFGLYLENNFDIYISFYIFLIFSASYYFIFYLFIRNKEVKTSNV